MRSRPTVPFALFILAAVVGACSTGGAATTSPPAALTVSDAWVRPPTAPTKPAAGYLVITNSSGAADALLSASTPAAASVEIHETTTDMNGMTGMSPVNRIDVPAGMTVRLQPGGFHLMINGLAKPLVVGETIELDLVFEHAGRVVVQAEVRQG